MNENIHYAISYMNGSNINKLEKYIEYYEQHNNKRNIICNISSDRGYVIINYNNSIYNIPLADFISSYDEQLKMFLKFNII